MSAILSSIYWDPSRVFFTIPWIEQPVTWYGTLFAVGFMVGYFLLARMFARELLLQGVFTTTQVESWPLLMKRLQSKAEQPNPTVDAIWQYLSSASRKSIQHWKLGKSISDAVKEDVVAAIQRVCDEGELASEPILKEVRRSRFNCWLLRSTAHRDGSSRYPVNRLALTVVMDGAMNSVRTLSYGLTDKLCWFIVAGTVIGARLGHVFFYEWDYYRNHLSEIPKTWHGGLASHGGAIGVLLALALCHSIFVHRLFPRMALVRFLDLIAVPTAFVGFCIRLGNFINQEILGTVSQLPWAVVFGHPAEGGAPLPRHPVQLYEGLFSLALFFFLYRLWARPAAQQRDGLLIGLFFTLTFTWRFFMEFFKMSLGGIASGTFLETGQLLSLPFILLGLWLIWRSRQTSRDVVALPSEAVK